MKAVKVSLITIFSLLGLGLLLMIVVIAGLLLRPQWVVSSANALLDTTNIAIQVQADTIELSLFPVHLHLEEFLLRNTSPAEDNSPPINTATTNSARDISISQLDLIVELWSWILEDAFWSLDAERIELVKAEKLSIGPIDKIGAPSANSTASDPEQLDTGATGQAPLNLPPALFLFKRIAVQEFVVDDQYSVSLALDKELQIAHLLLVLEDSSSSPQGHKPSAGGELENLQIKGKLYAEDKVVGFALHVLGRSVEIDSLPSTTAQSSLDGKPEPKGGSAANHAEIATSWAIDANLMGTIEVDGDVLLLNLNSTADDSTNIKIQLGERYAEDTNVNTTDHDLSIQLANFAYDSAADDVDEFEFEGAYRFADQIYPIQLDAEVDNLLGDPGISADIRFAETRLELDMQIQTVPLQLRGKLDLQSERLPEFVSVQPFSRAQIQPLNLGGEFDYSAQRVQLTEFELDAPSQQFGLSMDARRPQRDGGEVANPATATTGWSIQAKIDGQKLTIPLVAAEATAVASTNDTTKDTTSDTSNRASAEQNTQQNVENTGTSQVEKSELEKTNPQSSESASPGVAITPSEKLFTADPLPLDWLLDTTLDIEAKIDELYLQEAQFSDLTFKLDAQNGGLRLKPFQGKFGDGGFSGDIGVQNSNADTGANSAEVDINFDLMGINLEAFGLVPKEELTGGAVESRITLRGSGRSTAELAASLNGDIALMVEGATLANDIVELAGSDVLMQMVNKLNPFHKEDPSTELECALVHFSVVDGVMRSERELVMETGKMKIVGDGKIQLASEDLDITFSPSAKQGVGINVGSLVKFMKLGGKLSSPTPEVDALGVLQSGAAIGAAISTGGISVLAEGLAKRAINAGSACNQFRSRQAGTADPTQDKAPQPSIPPAPQEQLPAELIQNEEGP